MTLVCLRWVWEGMKVTASPHQEQEAGLLKVAEGQMRHTTPYHASPRPPMSTGGRQRRDTPPSPLSYSQERETGAEGGPEREGERGRERWGKRERWRERDRETKMDRDGEIERERW